MVAPISLVVLAVTIAATAVAFFVLRGHAERIEERRLGDEAQLGVVAFDSVAQEIESIVAGAGAIAVATDGDPAVFEATLSARTEMSLISSLVLLRVGDDGFHPVSEVGRRQALLPRAAGPEFERRMDEIAAVDGLEVVKLASLDEGRVLGLAARAEGDSEYLVYAELLLPEVLSITGGSEAPDVRYALYIGDESPESLIVSNTDSLPIEGRRVTRSLRLGHERPLLVFASNESLAGAFTNTLPSGVLGLGLALSIIVAALVESTRRRTDQALALVQDLEQKNAQLDRSEERYRSLFENANDLVFVTDTEGVFRDVNRAAEELIGYSSEELIGRRFEELVAPASLAEARTARERKIAGEVETTIYEAELVGKNGEKVQLELTSQLVLEDGRPIGVQGIGRDMRERHRLEARFRSLVQNSSDVIAVVSDEFEVDYVSPSVVHALGYRVDELIGTDLRHLLDSSDRRHVMSFLSTVHADEPARSTEVRVRAGDGGWRDVEIVASNLLHDPAIGGIVLTIHDLTERTALEKQLKFQAFHDPLTGLANRALFADRVEHALSRGRRQPESVAVLFLDVDDFKTVNDSLGHEAGDRLLVALAERLSAGARSGDTCARLGGDEFGVLLESIDGTQHAVTIARRLRSELSEPVSLDDRDVGVRVSIGVAVPDGRDATTDDLLRNADAAMYAAKRERLEGFRVYEPDLHEDALARLELKAELERALARAEFTSRYQPIVDLRTGRVAAIEALIRWDHPRRGLLAPSEFIDLAEETGLIVPLGRLVLGDASRLHHELRAARLVDESLTLSINASTRELDEPGFSAEFAELLKDLRLDPEEVMLEITESALVRDTDAAVAKLEQLRALGVRLAVDDFGTGYSSFSTLHRFPVDMLKIAKPFIDDVTARQHSLADAIVRLGTTLGLDAVAEGIETADQLRELRQLGCAYGQGYYLASPLQADQIVEFFRKGPNFGDLGDAAFTSAA